MLLQSCVHVRTRRAEHTVADVLRAYLPEYEKQHRLSYQQRKVVNAIMNCRTAALGGYIRQCDVCGKYDIAYCSCKDRHCPTCGHFEKARWLEQQKARLLPIPYFQVVFTIDHALVPLVWRNQRRLYDLLFHTAARLLQEYGQRYLGGELGCTVVLHTWGQTMQAHPHLHCIVTGGALVRTEQGARWQAARPNYLFPVVKLSRDFRAAFCAGIRRLHQQGWLEWDEEQEGQTIEELLRQAESQRWEVYIEPPQKDLTRLIGYLASYIYRIAISNFRLLKIEHGQVTGQPGWGSGESDDPAGGGVHSPLSVTRLAAAVRAGAALRVASRRGQVEVAPGAGAGGQVARGAPVDAAGVAEPLCRGRPGPVPALWAGADATGARFWAGDGVAGGAGRAVGGGPARVGALLRGRPRQWPGLREG